MSDILHSHLRSLGAPMLFSVLPAALQEILRQKAPPRRYAEGQILQQRGDEPDGFWLIDSGSIAVGQYLRGGEFRSMALLGPGDSWGELAMFAGRQRVVDAVARSDCLVRHIRSAEFASAVRGTPSAMWAMLGALSQQLQEMLDVVASIRRGSAPARIAGLLATMSDGSALPARIAISQHELGELLGLTRATINSALRDQERLGLLRRTYGAMEIIDREGLRQAALE